MRLIVFLALIALTSKLSAHECLRDGHDSVILISPADQANIGLRSIKLTEEIYTQKLSAFGKIVDPQMLLNWRNKWLQALGQWMKLNQSREYAQKNYERQKSLFETNQNTSEKSMQEAQTLFNTLEIEEKASLEALENLDSQVRLQLGAVLKEWIVNKSQEFDKLVNAGAFLLQISLPPSKLISMPQKITVVPYPQIFEEAALISPAMEINNFIQNASFFYIMETVHPYAIPFGLNVQVYIPTTTTLKGVIVPSSAVVWWEGKAWVYLQKTKERFSRIEISTKHPLEQGWFVQHEIQPGQSIVTVGAQEILSKELSPNAQAKNDEDND